MTLVPERPRIAYILFDFHISGMGSWLYTLASRLCDEFEIHFIATLVPEISSKFYKLGFPIYVGSGLSALEDYLRHLHIDLVQYANSREYAECAFRAGVPVVIERTDGLRNGEALASKDDLDAVIASTRGTVPAISQLIDPRRVYLIYNGVDIRRFSQVKPERLGFGPEDIIIGRVGRLGPGKNISLLIEATHILQRRHPQVAMVIVGGDSKVPGAKQVEEDLRRQATGLGNRAVFTGPVENPEALIQGFDIATCVSRVNNEGIPNSLLEPMAAGKAVVSSDVGDVCELIEDGRNGLLFQDGDLNGLVASLERLVEDATLRHTLGEQAKATVQLHFSGDTQAEKYRQLYRDLLANHRNPLSRALRQIKYREHWIGPTKPLIKPLIKSLTPGPLREPAQALYREIRFVMENWPVDRSQPRVRHGAGGPGIGGPAVKLWRMQQYFPDTPRRYNLIYTVSGTVTESECRRAKRIGIPVICHVNSCWHPAYASDWQERNLPFANIHNELAEFIVYGSHHALEGARRYLGIPTVPFDIIYNALDTRVFIPHTPIIDDRFNVLVIGYHTLLHRIEPAIRAMPYLQRVYPQARLIIAGKLEPGENIWDCSREYLARLFREVGLEDVTFFPEYDQEEAPGIYHQGDILVHLKHMDWTPNTVIEGMACGLPILHTGNGGLPELVGEAGLSLGLPDDWDHIHTPDPYKLAVAMMKIYEQRHDKGELARQIAMERYDVRQWITKHQELFERVLSR